MRIEEKITFAADTIKDVLIIFSIDQKKGLPPNVANAQYGLDKTEVPFAVTHIRWFAKGLSW